MNHFAIQSKGFSVKDKWMQQMLKGDSEIASLRGKKGLLFSTVTLQKLIEDEKKHEKYVITEKNERGIHTYSSGEQRKALLNYQINQQPDFLVLHNPFDCLDVESVDQLKKQLGIIADTILIVQLFKRHEDILTFISKVVIV